MSAVFCRLGHFRGGLGRGFGSVTLAGTLPDRLTRLRGLFPRQSRLRGRLFRPDNGYRVGTVRGSAICVSHSYEAGEAFPAAMKLGKQVVRDNVRFLLPRPPYPPYMARPVGFLLDFVSLRTDPFLRPCFLRASTGSPFGTLGCCVGVGGTSGSVSRFVEGLSPHDEQNRPSWHGFSAHGSARGAPASVLRMPRSPAHSQADTPLGRASGSRLGGGQILPCRRGRWGVSEAFRFGVDPNFNWLSGTLYRKTRVPSRVYVPSSGRRADADHIGVSPSGAGKPVKRSVSFS